MITPGRESRRVVLVSGAAGGIGSVTVALFRELGWAVAALDRRAGGTDADLVLLGDVALASDLDVACAGVLTTFGRLDALVNNAADQVCAPAVDMDPADWDRVMASNVRGAYLAAVRVYPLLKATRGSIVNVSSIHALATSIGMSAYAASKAALVSLTRSLALEFAADGVRVNAVLPGAVNTPMLRAGLERAGLYAPAGAAVTPLEALVARHPIKRIGEPAEIARSIYFLADGTWSSFVTGTTLLADGGAYARLSTE